MAKVSFSVEGLSDCDAIAAHERDDLLHTLAEEGFEVSFDPGPRIFSVQLDPALHSFADVRRAIATAGQRRGQLYLALVMSP
jgi:hypothetical protein